MKLKSMKKWLTVGAAILAVSVFSAAAFADSAYKTPAEAAAGVTGRTVESVETEHDDGRKSYGTIANEAGKLTEFRAAMLEMRRAQLAERVASGAMTQERADSILAAMEANSASCDGTGAARMGRGAGLGGRGTCTQDGTCARGGAGCGQRMGRAGGMGFGDGRAANS